MSDVQLKKIIYNMFHFESYKQSNEVGYAISKCVVPTPSSGI